MEKPNRKESILSKLFHPKKHKKGNAGNGSANAGGNLDNRNSNDPTTRISIPLPPPPNPSDDVINRILFFHPRIQNKNELQTFMSDYILQDGYYLLRRSFNDQNSYTISVTYRNGLKHIRVNLTADGKFALKDRTFSTIDELVQYYSYNQIPNEEHIGDIYLRFPINRPPLSFGDYITVATVAGISQTNNQHPDPSNRPSPRPPASGAYQQANPVPPMANQYLPQPPGRTSAIPYQLAVHPTIPANPSPLPPVGENDSDERCDCGLFIKDSALPEGWSVHISRDPDTQNQIFFLSPSMETRWEMPMSVSLLLSPEQQDFIRNLSFDSDIQGSASAKYQITNSKCFSIVSKQTFANNTCASGSSGTTRVFQNDQTSPRPAKLTEGLVVTQYPPDLQDTSENRTKQQDKITTL